MRSRRLTSLIGTIGATLGLLVCGAGAATAAPLSQHIAHPFIKPPTTADCLSQIGIACYQPFQFQQAYDMNPLYQAGLTGKGKTIVLVDSFGSSTIRHDLAKFDRAFNLPAPPSFNIIHPVGQNPPYDTNNYDMGVWGFETSLDVEYAHAMAPGANILLVETPVDETLGVQGFPQMIEAENYVIDHNLGDVISQSFGASEQTFPSPGAIYSLRSAYFNALLHRVTVLASAGDSGPTDQSALNGPLDNWFTFRNVGWPSSDPLVTSVGGTQLNLDANGNRTAPDNVWNDTALFGSPAAGGGGVSSVFSRPLYQWGVRSVVGNSRGVPDISLSAAVNGAALVYMSLVNNAAGFTGPAFYLVGGTSEASPLLAGIVAVADQAVGQRIGLLNPLLYLLGNASQSPLTDITAGDNSVSGTQQLPPLTGQTFSVQGFNAVSGYDLASGLGTVDGARFVDLLSHLQQFRGRH